MLDLTAEEREYTSQLLKTAHDQLIHEIDHTDTRTFKDGLRKQLDINEQLTRKLAQPQ
ncbi:MAG TPA: hypothetical protein VGJ81_14955 [Thermoanaerobaculia bacterium]|jgi:hypothetical protein